MVRLDSSGNLNYIYNFGGTNPDYAQDMKLYGSKVLVMGYSQSSGLSNGFLDIFVVCADKDTLAVDWVKYIGTPSFNEYAKGFSVMNDGSLYMVG